MSLLTRIATGILALAVLGFSVAHADGPASTDTNQLTKLDETLSAQGDQSLGDSVDLYSGALTFSQTDVSLPGNSVLPVAVTRRFDVARGQTLATPLGASFYTWQLDLPRIETTLATSAQWPTNRCTSAWSPPAVSTNGGSFYFMPWTYWAGYKINFPGKSALMLKPNSTAFPHPSNFTWIAAGNIGISCTTATTPTGASAGDGFTVWLPDGTHYDLTMYVTATATPTWYLYTNPNERQTYYSLPRTVDALLVTKATDRFGNTVSYTYNTDGTLHSITSSDNRTLTLTYTTVSGVSVVYQVTDGTRTWTYGYSSNDLTSVTRPDNSKWTFSMAAMAAARAGDPYSDNTHSVPVGLPATATMTSPYGLTGTFTVDNIQQSWANYPYGSQGMVPYYYNAGITQKQLTGPNLTSQTWNYGYYNPPGWLSTQTPGQQTKNIQVTDPSGTMTKTTFNINYDYREGEIDEVDVYPSGSSTAISTTVNTYASTSLIGTIPGGLDRNPPLDANARLLTQTVLNQNGDSFTTQYQTFDAFNNATQIYTTNSLGNTRTQTRTFTNNSAGSPWVISVPTGSAYGGVQVSQITLNSQFLLYQQYAFGLLKTTNTYNSDGTLYTSTDALSHQTTFASYYRGKAQQITRPDSVVLSKVINPTGTVANFNDARGNTTTLAYDSLNRLNLVQYPGGDPVTYANRGITYVTLTASELGMPIGTFRVRSTVGNMQKSTYYDPELHPILVQELDTATSIAKYTKSSFDFAGRVIFQSYPSTSYTPTTGINSYYDSLGRLTQKKNTDGTILQTTAYLSGNKLQVTDNAGNIATTTYQVFEKPDYSKPTLIVAPQSQTTTINRDVFGNITSAVQSGGGATATRSYAYDSNYRLCRQTDPEAGTTLYGYDADNQLAWQIQGQTSSTCVTTAPSGATLYQYDVLGRKTLDDYPGTTDDVSYGYDADSHLTSSTNYNIGTLDYTYNHRGLPDSEFGGKFVYTYDTLGHLSQKTSVSGLSIAYAPDAWGRPTQLGSYVTGIQYYPNDTPSSYHLGNGLNYSAALDSWQRLQNQTVTGMQNLTYSYNNDNDLTSISDSIDGTESASMTYDGLHRLQTANSSIWGNYTYGYDALNNIKTRTGTNPVTYNVNATTNLLSSVSGAVVRSYGYDAAGHVTSDGVHSYTWNGADQIAAIPGVASYYYDGNGKRFETVLANGEADFTYFDGSGQLATRERYISASNDTVTDYLQLAGQTLVEVNESMSAKGTLTPTYLHPDLLGSPRLATTATGAWLWKQIYDPYGQNLNTMQDARGYTGHLFDAESNLTYAQARYYDPAVGRFLSMDPMGFRDTASFNQYAYVGDSPYDKTDPTGTTAESGFGGFIELPGQTGTVDHDFWDRCNPSPVCFDASGVASPVPLPAVTVNGVRPLPDSGGSGTGPDASFQIFLDAAQKASDAFPFRWFNAVPPMFWLRGIQIHAFFASEIRLLGNPMYSAEVSYKNGQVVPYGTPGSVRADGVYGPVTSPIYAVELKTGMAIPTPGEMRAYRANLPGGTDIHGIVESPFPVLPTLPPFL